MTGKRKPRKHWYLIHIGECPGCGRDAGYRERQYSPRPKRPEERYRYLNDTFTYCGCLA